MEVVCNGKRCIVDFRGSTVTCTPTDVEGSDVEADVFTTTEITQLLRSRRDGCTARIVVGARAFIMQFTNAHEREQFIKNVRLVDGAEGGNTQWVASAICNAAVDTGVLSEEDLELIMKEECPRGVVTVFDAIGSLVDPVTFKLRPITEQLTNDIFRQIPVLAKIFSRHVTDEETMARFWEAVVKKYFCFSRTFLEEEIRALDDAGGGGDTSGFPSSTEDDALQSINLASGRALPKSRPHVACSTNYVDGGPVEPPRRPHYHLFRGRSLPAHAFRQRQCGLLPCQAYAEVARPPVVPRELPKNANREVLETLKRFWGSDTNQRHALRSKLEGLRRKVDNSVLQRRCLDRSLEFLDEVDSGHGRSTADG